MSADARADAEPARATWERLVAEAARLEAAEPDLAAAAGDVTAAVDPAAGLARLLGRFLPISFVLGLADSLARQRHVPESDGTLPTHRPLFIGMLFGVTVVVVALTYFPSLALGPLAEGLHR